MNQKMSLDELPIQGKKVLMRVDFNVPLDKQGKITDDSRIVAALPSIKYVLEHGGTLILMSHLGRPKQKSPELSLAPCAKRLSELLKIPVTMTPDCIGSETAKLVHDSKPGQVILLENLRFHKAEEHPEEDPSFAKQLATLGDLYVNDAFGTAHRAHSSTVTMTQYFPGKSAAGFLLQNEVKFLSNILKDPQRPFLAIIGGAKISTKIGVLDSLIQKVDCLLIGGGMAFTFLEAQGKNIGDSIHEPDFLKKCQEIMEKCRSRNVQLLLPEDLVIANKISSDATYSIINLEEKGIPAGFQGVDIGPKTVQKFADQIRRAKTVFWNGPVGVFEVPEFAKGTYELARVLANAQGETTTIVGGGDSIAALRKLGVADQMSHLSTGGGASLEFLEFGTLPGIEALSDKQKNSKAEKKY